MLVYTYVYIGGMANNADPGALFKCLIRLGELLRLGKDITAEEDAPVEGNEAVPLAH